MGQNEKIKELTFTNTNCKLVVTFMANCVYLKERVVVSKRPKNLTKQPCTYRKLKNGKYALTFKFFIPNGFIFDALCIKDESIIDNIKSWLNKLVDVVSKSRQNKED